MVLISIRKAYIAGKITNDPDYRKKFSVVAGALNQMGYRVMSPAVMPDGFDYEDYMTVCFAMMSVCEICFMLPDWKESPGAQREHTRANEIGMEIQYLEQEDLTAWLELAR